MTNDLTPSQIVDKMTFKTKGIDFTILEISVIIFMDLTFLTTISS